MSHSGWKAITNRNDKHLEWYIDCYFIWKKKDLNLGTTILVCRFFLEARFPRCTLNWWWGRISRNCTSYLYSIICTQSWLWHEWQSRSLKPFRQLFSSQAMQLNWVIFAVVAIVVFDSGGRVEKLITIFTDGSPYSFVAPFRRDRSSRTVHTGKKWWVVNSIQSSSLKIEHLQNRLSYDH